MQQAQDSPRGSYWQIPRSAFGKVSPRSLLPTADGIRDEFESDRAQAEQGSHERTIRCEGIRKSTRERMMDHRDVLKEAQSLLSQRGNSYGEAQYSFARAATLMSVLSGKSYSAYDMSLAMLAIKLSRLANSPDHHDSWVDGINYMAFCAEFQGRNAPDAVLDLSLKRVQSNLNEAIRGESNG